MIGIRFPAFVPTFYIMLPDWKLKRIAYDKLPTQAEVDAIPTYKERLRIGRIIDARRKKAFLWRQKRAVNANLRHINLLALKVGDWTNEGQFVRIDENYIYIKNMHNGVTQIGISNPNLLMLRRGTKEEILAKKATYVSMMESHIESLPRLKMD